MSEKFSSGTIIPYNQPTSNIMAELQKVVILPLQNENMGERGGADSQNQQEVGSHTDVLTRQEQKPELAVVASKKGYPTYMVMIFSPSTNL